MFYINKPDTDKTWSSDHNKYSLFHVNSIQISKHLLMFKMNLTCIFICLMLHIEILSLIIQQDW